MMGDEPTLGEVMRQMQTLMRQIEQLVTEVRSDYVRKDLYDAKYTAAMQRLTVAEAETEDVKRVNDRREQERRSFQRQILGGLIVGGILLIASMAVTVLLALGGVQ